MKTPSDPVPDLPAFLEARRQGMTYGLGFSSWQGPVADWQARLRRHWTASLPSHRGLPRAKTDGEAVRLTFATGARAEGTLRFPGGSGPHPAILLLHDHGGDFARGWRKLAALPESLEGQLRHYGGAALIERCLTAGFAVLCLDALGWGGRQTGGYRAQQALAANAMHLGWSLAGLVAAEDLQAAAWLSAHPQIDATRIGAFGFSFGGFRSWQVAALSPHIASAAVISWMARRADLMAKGAPLLRGHSAFYMLHPALGGLADFPDMAGLAAGKPLFFRSGTNDPHMPVASVQDAWRDLARISAGQGGPPPDTDLFDGGHNCDTDSQDEALRFLTRTLSR